VVWPDARFSGRQGDGIAFSKSLDGGRTWSVPVQINRASNVQAFTPSIAMSAQGAIAVAYFDFRKDGADPKTLLATLWRIVSHRWKEDPPM
jgi:hypothetical protein